MLATNRWIGTRRMMTPNQKIRAIKIQVLQVHM